MENMTRTSRRSFLQSAPLACTGLPALAQQKALSAIGVQLYTVRTILPRNPSQVLEDIESIGYREIEATADHLDIIWPALRKTKLAPVSLHLGMGLFAAGKEDDLKRAVDDAKSRGFQFVVYPYVMPEERGGADVYQRLAQRLNAAGKLASTAGLQLCYHNHAFEYQPIDSSTPLAILMDQTDPKWLALELDVFWASIGGHDPVEILEKYSGRVPLVHLKDKAKDTPVQYNEQVAPTAFKEVGKGALDFPAILRAASAHGVKHYFVEQDQTPGNPIDSLRDSFGYLRKLRY